MHKTIKRIGMLACLFIGITATAQVEGQSFCDDFPSEEWFPLDIQNKTILWSNTYYIEEYIGDKTINRKDYKGFSQSWENGNIDTLYFRKEKQVTYQYEECCNQETVRFNAKFKKGEVWNSVKNDTKYTLLTYHGSLKTPFCNYEDLMVLQAEINGTLFHFYYKQGYGYVGATIDKNIISAASPVSVDKLKQN